jgi:hypothetical protein
VAKEPKTIQTALRLPNDLYARLKEEADRFETEYSASGGISEVIRSRLAASFSRQDRYDAATRDLGEAFMEMARAIKKERIYGWNGHEKCRQALIAAIDLISTEESQAGLDFAAPILDNDDPHTIGTNLAQQYLKRRKEIREIVALADAMDEREEGPGGLLYLKRLIREREKRLAVTDREERLEAAMEAASDAEMQIKMQDWEREEAAQRRRGEIATPKREAKRRGGEVAPPPKSGAKKLK